MNVPGHDIVHNIIYIPRGCIHCRPWTCRWGPRGALRRLWRGRMSSLCYTRPALVHTHSIQILMRQYTYHIVTIFLRYEVVTLRRDSSGYRGWSSRVYWRRDDSRHLQFFTGIIADVKQVFYQNFRTIWRILMESVTTAYKSFRIKDCARSIILILNLPHNVWL